MPQLKTLPQTIGANILIRRLGIGKAELKNWEEYGLLTPKRERGKRVYSAYNIRRARLITKYRMELSLSLEEVALLLNKNSKKDGEGVTSLN